LIEVLHHFAPLIDEADQLVTSSTFDQAKCTAEGDAWDITNRTQTAAELTAMSCTDFDGAI
jgi:hypothetical protein